MIVLPVFWIEYTATASGRVLKHVSCENCTTEYVYILSREAIAKGAALYGIIGSDAEDAKAGADEALKAYLENDYDPVPCPECGHYQRHMFPKLYVTTSPWTVAIRFAVLALGLLDGVGVLFWTINYLEQPNDHALWRMITTGALLVLFGLIGLALGANERANARRFDPNTEDQQARIALGRSRAITKAELESKQQLSDDPIPESG